MLCVTETWIGVGESSVFSEVLPPNCTYFNSPRLTGRGGGVATIFKVFKLSASAILLIFQL